MADIELKQFPTYDQEDKINTLLIKARAANKAGDVSGALALRLKAWDLLPAPKEQWFRYPKVAARGIADSYLRLGDEAKFREWMNIAYQIYHDPERKNIYVMMDEGIGLYKLGRKDEAAAIFWKAFRLYGEEAFPVEYSEYYKFMIDNAGRF